MSEHDEENDASPADLQTTIIANLIRSDSFCRKALPHIKPKYFEGAHKIVYELVLAFISKYNKLPNATVLEIEFQNSPQYGEKESVYVDSIIKAAGSDALKADEDWMVDATEKWCKERAVYLAIMESIGIIDGKDKEGQSEGSIPKILSDALSVSFDTNVGHDYLKNAEERFAHYHRVEDKIPFDLEMMNTITKGGVPRKTLNIILAGTAVGKSLAMCHFASAYLAQGKNVLYITLEMSEEKIAERLDFNLFDMVHDDITNMTKASFCSKVKQIADKTHGNLVIKEYPTAAAHAGHFRALIQELKLKKNFVPDVIFIDYLNICASSRIKGLGGSVNSYTLIKSIAEELRGLAVEFDLPIWSATQVTRSGFANTDIEITDTSESFGLPATADLMIALISTEQLEKMNQLMVKQLKNRYYDCNTNKRFTIGIDRSKMRLYDVEDPHANVMTDNAPQQTSAKTTPFTAGGRQKPNFNGFKT